MNNSCQHGYGVCGRCASVDTRCRCNSQNVRIHNGPCFACARLTDEQAVQIKAENEKLEVGYRYTHPFYERSTEGLVPAMVALVEAAKQSVEDARKFYSLR